MLRILRILLLTLFILAGVNLLLIQQSASAQEVATITGRVVDEWSSNPMPDIDIFLIDPADPQNESLVATTDSTGYYTATQPISATWIVRFAPSDPSIWPYVPEYYNDTYEIANATLITAEVGTVTPNINASLAAVRQLSGRVTDAESGAPVEGVFVALLFADNNQISSTANTGPSGYYTLTMGEEGNYKLRFDPRDASPYALEYHGNASTARDAATIIVDDDLPRRIDAELGLGGVITGLVTSSWGNQRIEYPWTYVVNEAGERAHEGSRFASDGSFPENPPGVYSIHNVPPGQYQISFGGNYHRSFTRPLLITVEAGETLPNINARLTMTPQVVAIATSPGVPNTIALTFRHDPSLIVSNDGGQSWQRLSNTPWVLNPDYFVFPDRFQPVPIAAGVAPRGAPGEGVRLIAGAGGTLTLPSPLKLGLYRSGDNGQSWAEATIDPPFSPDVCYEGYFQTPVTSPLDTSVLYVIYSCQTTGFTRLLVSQDSGVSWRDISTVGGRTLQLYVTARVLVSPHTANEVYLYDGASKWLKSTDGGSIWADFNIEVRDFVFDAANPAFLTGWSPVGNTFYNRIGKRSTDGGATWQDWVQQPCPPGLGEGVTQIVGHPTLGQTVFVHCANNLTSGIYRSDSGGDYWKRLTTVSGQMLVADLGTPGRLLWARDDGLWASTDLGETWQVLWPGYGNFGRTLHLPSLENGP